MFLGCISLQGNSLLSPASPIYPHRAQPFRTMYEVEPLRGEQSLRDLKQ